MKNLKIILYHDCATILVIIISYILFRIAYLMKNKNRFSIKSEFIVILMIVYLIILAKVVTYNVNEYGLNNYIPFKEITRYKINSNLFIQNIIGNILLFIPVGMFLKYYLKLNLFSTILLVIIYSTFIESTQLVIGRVFDVDDIILNLIGALIGFYFSIFAL